jgi:hypothetical protein
VVYIPVVAHFDRCISPKFSLFGYSLSKAGGGRKPRTSRAKASNKYQRSPGKAAYGGGGSEEAAFFIAGTAAELSKVAQRHGLPMLEHLLDMVQLEADNWLRKKRGLS